MFLLWEAKVMYVEAGEGTEKIGEIKTEQLNPSTWGGGAEADGSL